MRKHHNKLFFGKYTHKSVFAIPKISSLYPTSNYYVEKIIKTFKENEPVTKIAKFILQNRNISKFRIQNNKITFYTNKSLSLNLINNFWENWCNVTTVDTKNLKLLKKDTVVCKRLPLGKFQYQVHVHRNMYYKITTEQRDQLYNYLTRNTDNATITNSNLKQWLSGAGAIHYDLNGYFYVKDEKALLPIYIISDKIVGHIRKFVKV